MGEREEGVRLRPTRADDLDYVDALETDPANAPFIGRWSREQHLDAITAADREHWIIEGDGGERLGYLIAYDLGERDLGAYVKRIVVDGKSRGSGRAALERFCAHAFADRGAPFVWLTVFPENTRAQRAYASLGFAERAISTARRDELRAVVEFSEKSLILWLAPPTRS